MTPQISVIMPIYNSAGFMAKGIEKILSQSGVNLELICVDDGSSDDSAAIIKSYVMADARVRGIFLKKNCGPGNARNIGLNLAQGEYIGFMDSDDYPADSYFYAKLLESALKHDADIVKGTYQIEGQPKVLDSLNGQILSNKHNFIYHFVTAIFRKVMLDFHKIYFPNLFFGEDPPFSLHAAIHANRIIITNEAELTIVLRSDSQQRKPAQYSLIKDIFSGLGITVDIMNSHVNFPKVSYIHNFVLCANVILRYCKGSGMPFTPDIILNDLMRIREDIAYRENIKHVLLHSPFFETIS